MNRQHKMSCLKPQKCIFEEDISKGDEPDKCRTQQNFFQETKKCKTNVNPFSMEKTKIYKTLLQQISNLKATIFNLISDFEANTTESKSTTSCILEKQLLQEIINDLIVQADQLSKTRYFHNLQKNSSLTKMLDEFDLNQPAVAQIWSPKSPKKNSVARFNIQENKSDTNPLKKVEIRPAHEPEHVSKDFSRRSELRTSNKHHYKKWLSFISSLYTEKLIIENQKGILKRGLLNNSKYVINFLQNYDQDSDLKSLLESIDKYTKSIMEKISRFKEPAK